VLRSYLAVALVILAPIVAAGCASASAKTPVDRPALNVPPPPPRVIETTVELDPEPVGDLPAAPTAPAPSKPSRTSRESTRTANANDAKADAKPDAKPPDPVPPPEPAPVTPPVQLQTPQTADTSGAARNVQATIDRARSSLNSVNYGPLSNDRKKAYNDVKRFITQAEEAVKQANFVFAQAMANKAETLAKELAGK